MFLMLYKSLCRTNTFDPTSDTYLLSCDEKVKEVLEGNPLLKGVSFITMPTPSSHLEGMLWKYQLHKFVNLDSKTVMYLDVDMLSVRTLKYFVSEDKLYPLPEGDPNDTNYRGSFTLSNKYGCSAGIFCYNFGPSVKAFFDTVLRLSNDTADRFYTVEQPFFNKALETMPKYYINPETVSFNGNNNLQSCRFISYAGDPGDQLAHWEKGFQFFLTFFA
jgi:hypothetical protein